MLKTQQTALTQAIALLTAAGARFAVIDATGQIHGDLKVRSRQPKPGKTGQPRVHHPSLQDKYGFWEKVDNLEPGGNTVIECETEEDATRLARAFSSRANARFGSGNYLAAKNGKAAELLRVA
jgi:hypothetical protein